MVVVPTEFAMTVPSEPATTAATAVFDDAYVTPVIAFVLPSEYVAWVAYCCVRPTGVLIALGEVEIETNEALVVVPPPPPPHALRSNATKMARADGITFI